MPLFQSSPALSSGRYPRTLHFEPETLVSILARPFERALQEQVKQKAKGLIVSILARPFERALRGVLPRSVAVPSFQSSPALSSGRYQVILRCRRLCFGFNPRPPFRAGATICRSVAVSEPPCFNPRPPFRAGATACNPLPPMRVTCFNPRPPFRAGATRRSVEILTQPQCFNPRPPFRAGATMQDGEQEPAYLVSILARPFERALLCRPANRSPPTSFQSSPALSSGRYSTLSRSIASNLCFNPRPPFRAGATCCSPLPDRRMPVSILARPFERALRATCWRSARPVSVSILARPFERALR